jgi:hypothetical protein
MHLELLVSCKTNCMMNTCIVQQLYMMMMMVVVVVVVTMIIIINALVEFS